MKIRVLEGLTKEKIAGAGIDVFDTEPPLSTDNPFFGLKNTVLTPHKAFATKEAFLRRADIVEDSMPAYLNGSPVNVMN